MDFPPGKFNAFCVTIICLMVICSCVKLWRTVSLKVPCSVHKYAEKGTTFPSFYREMDKRRCKQRGIGVLRCLQKDLCE